MGSERISVTTYADAHDFLRAAEAFLRASPAEYNLILSIAESLAERGGPVGDDLLATVHDMAGLVVGAAFRTPPHKVGLTRMPAPGAALLADALARRYEELPAVLGPKEAAEPFARRWSARRGVAWHEGEAQNIYRLDAVEEPREVPGLRRPARPEELERLDRWGEAFGDELGSAFRPSPERRREWVRDGRAHFWEVEGRVVAMAVGQGFTSGGARIGFVYTPPEERGRGWASALVASLSRHLLESGREFCMLYALASNPQTNRIYQRIGYRRVAEVVDLEFAPEPL